MLNLSPNFEMKRIVLFFLLLFFANVTFSQEDLTGNWLMYFGMNRISDDWSVHTEVQYRNHKIAPVHIEQLLLRFGMNYHLSNSAILTGGYGYIGSHDFESEPKRPDIVEHRIWQQLILINKVDRIKFEHRYRVEQRWVEEDYLNRLRYRLMLFVPINKPEMTEGTVFLGIYDELFMNTKGTFFDRNRLYAALGYQFDQATQVQVGLLHQRVNDFGKYYLQFGLIFNPDFRNRGNDKS